MSKTIGIDLGTSNSAASYMEGGKPKMIPSQEGTTIVGGKAFPSYVAFDKDGELLVGEPARRQSRANPEKTIFAAKRKMGTDYKYKIDDKEYTPQQISAFILQKIKKDAEDYLGEEVNSAVITVPAYFDDSQRQATKDAGKIAGLEVLRLVNEPTAASFAYGLDKVKDEEQNIMVFDMGAGTLDVTVMNIARVEMEKGKKESQFEVVTTSGDTKLGGKDMDDALVKYILKEFKDKEGIDVSSDKMAMQRLRTAAEKAKIELSSVKETDINLPFITANDKGPKHLNMKITRTKMEELARPIVEKSKDSIKTALSDAKMDKKDIDRIILVGGPTRMPLVKKFIKENIGEKIERGIDPMECVAMGAAIQAAILSGDEDVQDVLLLDVTPLTLGIETLGGITTPLIEKNTTIPTSESKVFSTASDNQGSVEINVVQGERKMASDNRSLGRFILDGIPPAPRGVPQIEVKFEIDANGILKVTAKDKGTGKTQDITIKGSTSLSDDEIEKMKNEAEQFAEKDKKKEELIKTRNEADNLIYTSEKAMKDAKDKIEEKDKKEIEEKVKNLKEAKDKNDIEILKKAIQELSEAVQKIGSSMYGQEGKDSNKDQQDSGSKNKEEKEKDKDKDDDEDTIEGEYEEGDNEDKK
ncbi:MAG TPA: molecular chaperone DnaK [Patescibacteria group bacterium]|nr:molecular chaperone DnaK [Patescibacteria group bacterium]